MLTPRKRLVLLLIDRQFSARKNRMEGGEANAHHRDAGLCAHEGAKAWQVPESRCVTRDSEAESSIPVADRMVALARYIESRPDESLSLADLGAVAGLSPSRVQRVFKEAFGVSPKAYQDALRLNLYKQALKRGQTVTEAIYDAGFGSVSRVYGKADRQVGMPPSRYGKGERVKPLPMPAGNPHLVC